MDQEREKLRSENEFLTRLVLCFASCLIGVVIGVGAANASESDKTPSTELMELVMLSHKLTNVINDDIKGLREHLKYIQVRLSSLETSHVDMIKECRHYE